MTGTNAGGRVRPSPHYVNGVLRPLAVGAGIDRDFVYGTANETFTVKAVDRAGNTSEASNAAMDVC